MKELIKLRRERQIELGGLKNRIKSVEDIMYSKLKPICNVMRDVEREVVAKYDTTNRSRYPQACGSLFGINSIKVKGDFIKVRTGTSYCGGYEEWGIKVPIKYFDMTIDDIRETHTKWSNEYLTKYEAKHKGIERATKMKKLLELKKELGE